jgi:SynChlorMet cassette protein ScmD
VKNDEKLIANPYVILREEFDDWAILFDPDAGHGFGLSSTGVFVWKLFNGEHTIDTLLEEIRFYAEDVPDEAENHIEAFVEELVREGLAKPNSTVSGLRNNADWTQEARQAPLLTRGSNWNVSHPFHPVICNSMSECSRNDL